MSNRSLRTLHRRELLAAIGAGVGAAAVAACGGSSTSPTADATTATTTNTTPPTTSSTCAVIPTETRGPYPDTAGMINNASFFRRDITESTGAGRS